MALTPFWPAGRYSVCSDPFLGHLLLWALTPFWCLRINVGIGYMALTPMPFFCLKTPELRNNALTPCLKMLIFPPTLWRKWLLHAKIYWFHRKETKKKPKKAVYTDIWMVCRRKRKKFGHSGDVASLTRPAKFKVIQNMLTITYSKKVLLRIYN